MLKKITKKQFDLYSYVRNKESINLFKLSNQLDVDLLGVGCIDYREVAWYISEDKRHLSIITEEVNDRDYTWVILGICENKMYKCIELADKHYPTLKSVLFHLRYVYQNKFLLNKKEHYGEYVDEGSTQARKTIDILNLEITKQELNAPRNQNFKTFFTEKAYAPARRYIQELAYSFYDVDGSFVKEFQLNFDARLLELYLYKYFDSQYFDRNTKHQQPDFCLTKYGKKYFVEAKAIVQNKGDWSTEKIYKELQKNNDFINFELQKYFGKQYLKALIDKRNHKVNGLYYWELPQVKGAPFIIAIQNYSASINSDSGRVGLERNLYGIPFYDPNIKKEIKVDSFFNEENSENISAVMFVNNATIGTFNRRGKLQGYGDKKLKIFRTIYPMHEVQVYRIENVKPLEIDIDDINYCEDWSEGITMYHNPKALYPIPEDEFLDITHIWFDKEENQMKVSVGEGAIYSSFTNNVIAE